MTVLFRKLCLVVLAVLPAWVLANDVRIVSGEATTAAYEAALGAQVQWFQRATNVCVSSDYCLRPLTMRITVGADGRTGKCEVTDSDIRSRDIRDLFCKIVLNTTFPASTGPVVADLEFGVMVLGQDRYERCPAELGARRDTPDLVRRCLEKFLPVLNSLRSSAIHQQQSAPESVSGHLRLRLKIAASGKVKDIDVLENSIPDWNFRRDVVHVLERFHFGPADATETQEIGFSLPFAGLEAQ